MGFFDFGLRPPTKKQRKRAILRENRRIGKAAENQAMMRDRMLGYEVERTGRGHDYRRRLRDPWTGRVKGSEVIEVKSSHTAPLSPLQKKTKKGRNNYRVVRERPYFF